MDVKVIPAEKWKRYIEVTVPAAEVEAEVNAALRRYQKKVQIQGFRKGKAPLHFVNQIYGGAIRKETLEEMVPRLLDEARVKNGLRLIGKAEMEDVQYDEKESLKFRAAMEVAPEIELREYKNFEFEKTLYEVAEADVDEAMESLREQKAVYRAASDEEVKDGYIVTVDLQKVDAGGFAIVGDKHENQRLLASAADEFTRTLIGARVGETRRASFTERLPDGKLAERPAYYQASIKEIAEKTLPALDEALAAQYNFQTLEELRNDVRKHLVQGAEQRTRDVLRREIVDELLKVNYFELPEKWSESYADKFFESVKPQFAGMPEEAIKDQTRAAAFRRLRWELLRTRIVAAENLAVSDDELRDYIVQVAFATNEEPQRLINRTMHDEEKREQMRSDLLEAKTLAFLETQMTYRERRAPYKGREPQRIITV